MQWEGLKKKWTESNEERVLTTHLEPSDSNAQFAIGYVGMVMIGRQYV